MSVIFYTAPITEGEELIIQVLTEAFKLPAKVAKKLASEQASPHLKKLKSNCHIVAETSYTDKVYRNSYYHYYSSKLGVYKRECIRLSFFENEINIDDFRNPTEEKEKDLKSRYGGFIILRPLEPCIIGRSVISPKILEENSFLACGTEFKTSVCGMKFIAEGFPYSSQDEETISCAETTLWAVMEYFSSKYQEFRSVLPSNIIDTLGKITVERQLPSNGLDMGQMSFALKEYGFGTRIYSRDAHPDMEFEKLISIYTESGIPLIIGIENKDSSTAEDYIGHALLCIGRDKIDNTKFKSLKPTNPSKKKSKKAGKRKKLQIYDWHDLKKEFVFVDDNRPVYQKAKLSNPTAHYSSKDWQACKIDSFIAPLYPKIYLEAYAANIFVHKFLSNWYVPKDSSEKDALIKTYLTSSRSFKNYLCLESTFPSDLKDRLIETQMPKFIWISELSNKALIKDDKANGIIIMDSTEANVSNNKPLIVAAYQGSLRQVTDSGRLIKTPLSLMPFKMYSNSLKTS